MAIIAFVALSTHAGQIGNAAEHRSPVIAPMRLDIGLGFRSGAALIEAETKEHYRASLLFGAAVRAGLDFSRRHFVGISVGHLLPLDRRVGGTEAVRVSTHMQLVDCMAVYEKRFRGVAIAAAGGPSFRLVETTTRVYDLGAPVIGLADDTDASTPRYVFPHKTPVYEASERGAEAGIAVALSFALDLGRWMGIEPRFFSLEANAQYVRRGRANEVYIWGALGISPTALRR